MGDMGREAVIAVTQQHQESEPSRPALALLAYAFVAVVGVAASYGFSEREPHALPPTVVRADGLQINGIAVGGTRLVAVGEIGNILLSDDAGRSWRNATLARQRHATLTAVTFLDPQVGIAVGWDGWALRSEDGGLSWQETRFEEDRSEPLLGVWAAGSGKVYAFGSFGRFLESSDAGRSWSARPLPVDEMHLNGMAGAGEHLMLVGEQGLVLRSADGGSSWEKLPPFFGGSLFGIAALSARDWVAYGIRGNVHVSHDFGNSWKKADVPVAVPFYGHTIDADGALLLVGAGGLALRSADLGASFQLSQPGKGMLTSAALLPDGSLLVGGDAGLAAAPAAKN